MIDLKRTLKEVYQSARVLNRLLAEGHERLTEVATLRQSLGCQPSLEAQRRTISVYSDAAQRLHACIIMQSMTADEALEDARKALAIASLRRTGSTGGTGNPRGLTGSSRIARYAGREQKIERQVEAYRRALKAEESALKAALPDWDALTSTVEVHWDPNWL